MASPDETYLAVLKASYDYDPQPDADEELAIKANQLLFLLDKTDDDWWKVKIKTENQDGDGPSGLVPAAYVEPAPHTSVVKALYDYDPAQSSELPLKESEILYVFDTDEDWLLVQSKAEGGKVGYVPGNYVEETNEDGESSESPPPAITSFPQIVVPPSPPRPEYVDPADRVAAASNKAQADDIQTWSVSELDKKGKKKKGTLGIGNGAVFFASEADKTPVQKWQTADIQSSKIEKSKHVHIDIGGPTPISLHFHAGSKDAAEAILAKLESSRALAAPAAASTSNGASSSSTPPREEIERPRSSAQKSVHFDAASPVVIPSEEPDDEEDEPEHEFVGHDAYMDGEPAVVLYDFTADGEDELSVAEGENLVVLERDTEEWWKCRNAHGEEGVVPGSYVELLGGGVNGPAAREEDHAAIAAREAQEAALRAEALREQAERRKRAEKEQAERERKAEAEQRAKAAAAAAEADRRRREQEREKQKEKERVAVAAEEEARQKKQTQRESSSEASARRKSDSSGSRASVDKRGPPSGGVRTWHDRTGQFKVDAAFLGFANGKIRLHKMNGVVIEVPSSKMSAEDMRYVEKMTNKHRPASPGPSHDDDDEPLENRRKSLLPAAVPPRVSPPKKGPTVDWFEFFLGAGCDVDDCSRYASSFERDKIDEAILPDITESTMRSLGLREGDIIRVKKAIETRQPKRSTSADEAKKEQLRRDEELARQLQAEENGGKRTPAPNLFAAGPNGVLKNNTVRRGRPQPSKSLPPASVDINSIATASDQIQRSSTPLVVSPGTPISPSHVQPPARSSSAAPDANGFDDDAWTNRPSSTKPLAPTPPVSVPRTPSAPPAPAPPPAPAQITQSQSMPVASTRSPPPAVQSTGSSLAKTTDSDIFNQLARLSQLRVQSPVVPPQPAASPAFVSPPPLSFQTGLGMSSSPIPLGQHLQAQPTGMLQNTSRGPYAPVPANQGLLQPLIPTTTGFNSFVPTRPQSTPSFQPPPQQQPQQPSFLAPQPTGFFAPTQPLLSQPTGFAPSGPLFSQPTGLPNGNFGSGFGGFGSVPPVPPLPTNNNFGQIQSNPTGFNPGFGQMPFNNTISPPPPPVPQPSVTNTSPANVFAQMKSGTFATNDSNPQSSDKYDALRPNPIPMTVQPTGWGYQGMNGMSGGYGYQ